MKFLAAFKRLIIFAGDWLLLWLAFLAAIFIRFHFHFDFLTYERGLLPFFTFSGLDFCVCDEPFLRIRILFAF